MIFAVVYTYMEHEEREVEGSFYLKMERRRKITHYPEQNKDNIQTIFNYTLSDQNQTSLCVKFDIDLNRIRRQFRSILFCCVQKQCVYDFARNYGDLIICVVFNLNETL